MCEICQKHGNGNKWYFNPKNYEREMGEARKDFLEKIAGPFYNEWLTGKLEKLDQLRGIPLVNKLSQKSFEKYEASMYGGQIIPLDDVLTVMELCENPALLPCPCREIVGKEKYYCLNFGLIPELYEKANPDRSIEEISVNKGKRLLKKWNKEGFYHLILWNKLPYATTVCNCTGVYCTAFKSRQMHDYQKSFLKGEYIARVDLDKCKGCKKCLVRCQFGAITFNVDDKKALVNITQCFGCGLCVSVCKERALELIERKITPVKNYW
jgi:ferredoxin